MLEWVSLCVLKFWSSKCGLFGHELQLGIFLLTFKTTDFECAQMHRTLALLRTHICVNKKAPSGWKGALSIYFRCLFGVGGLLLPDLRLCAVAQTCDVFLVAPQNNNCQKRGENGCHRRTKQQTPHRRRNGRHQRPH